AQFSADHLVALALLYVGNACQIRARLCAFRRGVADIRLPGSAPRAAAARGMTRSLDVARADLPPLDFVRSKQPRAAPTPQRSGKLPRQIDGIADAAVHAEAAGRDDQMYRI